MRRSVKTILLLSALASLALMPGHGQSRTANQPPFAYVGGTEPIHKGCRGKLEVTPSALVFICLHGGSARAPYDSIKLTEYRSKVSKAVRKMKVKWAVKPPRGKSKHNAYFTIVYSDQGATRAIVLKVSPDEMRPYLSEIDLRTGHRVEVEQHY